jgi:hypothetical protein
MDELIGIALLGAFYWYWYRYGKREGSRKGFYVGRRRGSCRNHYR